MTTHSIAPRKDPAGDQPAPGKKLSLEEMLAKLEKLDAAAKPKKTAREINAAADKSRRERLAEEMKTAPDRAVARKKTGYVSWTPVAIRHVLRWETCQCCGRSEPRFEGSFYIHENKIAHATWMHPEGMLLPLDGSPLPVEVVITDDAARQVPICGACHGSPEVEDLIRRAQQQMEMPV